MTDGRPDPTTLLERLRSDERREKRGKLKIFLGASPGVGKTYAMLTAARKLYSEGVDVVIGVVETHKRAETAVLLLGLDLLPRRDVEYRSATLSEFDLDAALERKPRILVVDELAHTNAPGSRFEKRWQDVQALLDAGIDVYTTLNVQHLESLNDIVSQITGITVRETVPDSVLEGADEVELIDLPPDALLERLRQGRVYMPEAAQSAASNYFRKGNLTALRELALRRTAEWVDAQMQVYKREHNIPGIWPAGERILVYVDESPLSGRLVRAAKRLAVGLHADLIAVSVETPESLRLDREERDQLVARMRLAESLDAETVTLSGRDVAEELVRYARSRNVSKIAIGRTPRPRWRELLFGSLVNDLIRESGDIEVYVIRGDQDDDPISRAGVPRIHPTSPSSAYWIAVLIVAASTGIAWLMYSRFDLANLAMVYLLGVALTAAVCGRGPSVLASILAVASFDYFFVPKRFTFAVTDSQYLVTFLVMLIVALLIGTMTVRMREQAESARERERHTASLYTMTRELAASRELGDLIPIATRHLRETFESSVAVLLPDTSGRIAVAPADTLAFAMDTEDLGVAQWAYDHGQLAGLGTSTLPGASAMYVPLATAQGKVGVLGVRPESPEQPFAPKTLYLLETFANQLALAIERHRMLDETSRAKLSAETERLRNALLSSVSHDLRTPLSVITGAASSLIEDRARLDEKTMRELSLSIYEEANRLNKLIANLVFATRLEAGTIVVRKEWLQIEEVVGVALNRMRESLKNRPVKASIPRHLPLVQADGVLIEQVLQNLLENCLRHTPAGTPIEVSAWKTDASVVVKVADRGPGLSEGTETRVFERFYRGSAGPGAGGMGLGLTICRGILSAHGGRIWAENEARGGAGFSFSLPLPETAPPEVRESSNASPVEESVSSGRESSRASSGVESASSPADRVFGDRTS
jgi:two-component system, OmpR family, sensor histidine kinase KdpD